MNLIHKLNKYICKKGKEAWIPETHKELDVLTYEFFKFYGEGLYNICFESINSDFVSKMISLLTGKYSHGFTVYYCENIKAKLTNDEWHRLKLKYYTYYGNTKDIDTKLGKIKILVLAGADSNGMNYFDYSAYQKRKQVIMKPILTAAQTSSILHSYLTINTMNALYDYMGLAFWWFNKMFDDERAWYCSEIMYDKFKEAGILIAEEANPAPTQIVKYSDKIHTIIRKD